MTGLRATISSLMATAVLTSVAHADPRMGAVLMVEDEGYAGDAMTEKLGVAIYGRFLEAGPYATVKALHGRERANERLAEAIRQVAATHDIVDVFCSVHTTTRTPAEWARLVPQAARKLRLVYSTACYGAQEERQAWEGVGARAVVTHTGINNPVVAMPYVLSRWLAGAPIGRSVAEGYRETVLGVNLVLSLPNVTRGVIPDNEGSRPMLAGDEALTIRSGAPAARIGTPAALVYSRKRGGSVGLALRALAGRFALGGGDVSSVFERLAMPVAIPAEALAKVQRVAPATNGSGEGQLEMNLSSRVDVPMPSLGANVTLRVGERVALRPGRVDVERREVVVHTEGLWLKRGILRLKLNKLALSPRADGNGWRAKASAGLWGFIPVSRSFDLGGSAPLAAGDTTPLRAASTPGLVGVVVAARP